LKKYGGKGFFVLKTTRNYTFTNFPCRRVSMKKEIITFLVVGTINTIVTWAIYWMLLSFFGHQSSYAITFCIGTLISWSLNSKKTFKVALSGRKLALYFMFYIASYFFGRSVLYLCVDVADIDKYYAIIIVTIVSIPVNFYGSRKILKDKASVDV